VRVHTAHTNFTAGEIADGIRFDLEKYTNGAERIENALVLLGGSAQKRGGTRFVAHTKNNKPGRLQPFVWSADQAYMLLFMDGVILIFRDGAPVTRRGRPLQIPTRWTGDDIDRLKFCQSADVLFIAHPRQPPMRLIRKADDKWELKTVKIVGGPYLPLNSDVDLSIKPNKRIGVVKLVAKADVFDKKHVGSIWRFYTPRNAIGAATWMDYSGYPEGDNAPDPWEISTRVQHAGRTYKVTGGTASPRLPKNGATPPTHTEGVQTYYNGDDETIEYEYLHDGSAAVKIISVTDGRRAVGRVIGKNSIPDETVEDGTPYWAEGAWSKLHGYPTAVAIHEQRLWFAGSPGQPQTVWASKTGDFYDFTPGAKEDDALDYTLGSTEVDDILWMAAGRVLIVGTSSGEYVVRASRLTEAVTPTNVTVTRDTNVGSAKTAPVGVESGLVFMARHGKSRNAGRVPVDYRYDYRIDGFAATPLNLLADHILKPGGANQIAWTRSPVPVLWVARNDGELVGCTLSVQQEVVAWHRHQIAGGLVEDIAVIPGDDGDDLWMVVKRTVQGKPVRHLEVLQVGLDEDENRKRAWFLDSALNYEGPPEDTFRGLNHLNGEKVDVLADGKIYRNRSVSAGRVHIPKKAKKVVIGLPFTMRIKTLPVEAGMQYGVAQGRKKIVPEVTLRVKASRGGKVGGGFDRMEQIFDDRTGKLITGDKRVSIDGGWTTEGSVCIEHDTPYPFEITALMMTVQTTES
jgi:hypothetical protein